ncbi:hypothetical protein N799_06795 [Lysobacter arseniciresistens ZS79]|uniref:Lectin n=1 Tax=Lysobacter arseniciresistens ZS79 TaxID=913325 RepID=A0A0A0EZS2_9GAMM|nr:hypothetical protein [Lysobacter arseniciresistens]KGM55558.1 hypothetical protein N799_06795 [Lysobacter arseniciresistens ZS79]
MPSRPDRILAAALLALAITACSADDGAAVDPSAAAGDPPTTIGPDAPKPAAPAPAPAEPTATGDARFDGYGPARFGMSADAVRAAWNGGDLGEPGDAPAGGPDGSDACFHLSPVGQPDQAYFAMMFEGGRFVRYSVANDGMAAPGGGRRGMDEAGLEALYGPVTDRSPHKYVDGEYLRVADPSGSDAVLLFETDADDVVTEWRVGLPPQVDYVEGCS